MTLALTAVAVAVGLAGAMAAVRSTADGPGAALRGLTVAGVLGGIAFAGAVAAAATWRVDLFGLVHLLYLLIVISVPITGVGVLVHARRTRPGRFARAAGTVLLVPALVGAYATHVEPFRLRVDHVSVELDAARSGDDEVRIAVLADLQTNGVGDHERRAIDEVLAAEPDLILLPGDLFQGTDAELERELPALQRELRRLRAPAGVFFVEGDVDDDDLDRTDRILEGSEIQALDGEVVEVQVGDRTVVIGGHRLDYTSGDAAGVRSALADAAGGGAITILLAHRPDTVLHLPPSSAIDLTVAGHTHGGQVVLPLLGPLITMSDIPRDAARGGLHEVDGNRLYVGPGVGMERGQAPQLRFLSRPAVAILTLTSDAG